MLTGKSWRIQQRHSSFQRSLRRLSGTAVNNMQMKRRQDLAAAAAASSCYCYCFTTIASNTIGSRSFLSTQSSTSYSDSESDSRSPTTRNRRLVATDWKDGPPTCFGTGVIANLAKSSVVGLCGQTVVLVTLATSNDNNNSSNNNDLDNDTINAINKENSSLLVSAMKRIARTSDFVPLKVDVQHRYHAVGRIPTQSPLRRDNRAATSEDILASRAVDRALRPLIKNADDAELHLQCSIQACSLFSSSSTNNNNNNTTPGANNNLESRSGHPIALCLNSASVALQLQGYLEQPVACVCLAVLSDGTIVVDPTRGQWEESGVAELLLAGTRDEIVMMEVSTQARNGSSPSATTDKTTTTTNLGQANEYPVGIPEEALSQLIMLGQAALQPLLDAQEEFCATRHSSLSLPDDKAIREELGLPMVIEPKRQKGDESSSMNKLCQYLLDEATKFCLSRLDDTAMVLFGMNLSKTKVPQRRSKGFQIVSVHPQKNTLISKAVRGRREQLVFLEIERLLLEEFLPSNLTEVMMEEYVNCKPVLIPLLSRTIHDHLLRKALCRATTNYGTRGDARTASFGTKSAGWKSVRPIAATVPALPDVVHGSALFERGETQVLCTVTLGAPKDGIPLTHPYQQTTNPQQAPEPTASPFSDLPVGSLRYIRTQEALISDYNSRKVKAEREMTGDSGTLGEVRRAFLHYDFPAYSTGTVQGGGGAAAAANRRAIGHGALAERAILPILPPAHQFPYAIRMTSEVTSSNGSSSMATVCGATMALLDAGVPIQEPVAGVSVGLALYEDDVSQHGLLLDITGTEDHYGYMDFKIAGTRDAVTALQLDVKRPLSLSILGPALDLAREGRKVILDTMATCCELSSDGILSNLRHRPTLKDSAPRVEIVRFDPVRKRDLIGPGGAVLRQLEDRFGVSLDLTQEGQCLLYGANRDLVAEAKSAVMDLVADVEVGGVYEGTVIELMDFGAVIELLRNKEGLLHVSEMGADLESLGGGMGSGKSHHHGPLGIVKQQLQIGQKLQVLCTAVDPVQGVIKLSRKALLLQKRQTANNY